MLFLEKSCLNLNLLVRWIEEEKTQGVKYLSSEDDSDPYSLSSSEDKGLEGTYTENMDRLLEMHVKQRVDVVPSRRGSNESFSRTTSKSIKGF